MKKHPSHSGHIDIDKLLREARKAREASEQLAKQLEKQASSTPKKSMFSWFSAPNLPSHKPKEIKTSSGTGSEQEKSCLASFFNKKPQLATPIRIEKLAPIKQTQKPRKSLVSLFLTALILVIVGGSIWLLFAQAIDCGKDNICFIEQANNCGNARMNTLIAQAEFKFSTNNCQLIKKLVKLSDEEPAAVKQALEGKSMTCKYDKESFDPAYLSTVTSRLDSCSGSLKTALDVIRLG